jgi:hypothetical protein
MKKKHIIRKIWLSALILSFIIIVGGVTGCSIKDKETLPANTSVVEEEVNPQEINNEDQADTDDETKAEDEAKTEDETKAEDEAKTEDETKAEDETKTEDETKVEDTTKVDEFKNYISLIGQKKDNLSGLLKEEPKTIDEGGLEFEKAQIRIWLNNEGLVSQVFTMNQEIDINGVKIGDDIKKFTEIFGEAISDKNGDAHFKYDNIYLSVNYDTKTGETFAVYILKEDF